MVLASAVVFSSSMISASVVQACRMVSAFKVQACDMELASVNVFSCVLVLFCEESVKCSVVRSSRYDGLSWAAKKICEQVCGVCEIVWGVDELVFEERELSFGADELVLGVCELTLGAYELVLGADELVLVVCEQTLGEDELVLGVCELTLGAEVLFLGSFELTWVFCEQVFDGVTDLSSSNERTLRISLREESWGDHDKEIMGNCLTKFSITVSIVDELLSFQSLSTMPSSSWRESTPRLATWIKLNLFESLLDFRKICCKNDYWGQDAYSEDQSAYLTDRNTVNH